MKLRQMSLCALFVALLAVCAWLSVPIPQGALTLQTFGIFLTLGLLGGKWGCVAIGTYLLLGSIGLPVFSGFRGGIGVLLSATGGYVFGFMAGGLLYWLITSVRPKAVFPAMVAGLFSCYLLGTVWFWLVYLPGNTPLSFAAAAASCVLPYLLPDALKLALACFLIPRLKRFV